MVDQRRAQVFGGGGAGQGVEAGVGQGEPAVADGLEQGPSPGPAQVGVGALRAPGTGQDLDEAVQAQVVTGGEQGGEVIGESAADACSGAEPFGLAAAPGAGQVGGNPGALPADRPALVIQARQHAF